MSILAGALALIALDALVTGRGPANVGGLVGLVSGAVRWFVDPAVPGIPNLAADRGHATSSSGSAYDVAGPAIAAGLTAAAIPGTPAPPAPGALAIPVVPPGAVLA